LSNDATKAWNATGQSVFNDFGSRILVVRLMCQDIYTGTTKTLLFCMRNSSIMFL